MAIKNIYKKMFNMKLFFAFKIEPWQQKVKSPKYFYSQRLHYFLS